MLWPSQYGQAGCYTKVSVAVGVGKMTLSTGISSHSPVRCLWLCFPLTLTCWSAENKSHWQHGGVWVQRRIRLGFPHSDLKIPIQNQNLSRSINWKQKTANSLPSFCGFHTLAALPGNAVKPADGLYSPTAGLLKRNVGSLTNLAPVHIDRTQGKRRWLILVVH